MKFTAEPELRVQVLPALTERPAAPLGVKVKLATPLKVRLPSVWLFVAPPEPRKASVPWLKATGVPLGRMLAVGAPGCEKSAANVPPERTVPLAPE